jgi:hypothetical protein
MEDFVTTKYNIILFDIEQKQKQKAQSTSIASLGEAPVPETTDSAAETIATQTTTVISPGSTSY